MSHEIFESYPVPIRIELPVRGDLRIFLIVAVVLALPVLPVLVGGLAFERHIAAWLRNDLSRAAVAWLAFSLLAADTLLPVPSSVVNTFAGARLGWLWGTMVSWAGMTCGAMIAYGLARTIGVSCARRLASNRDLEQLESVGRRWGVTMLVALRGLPILAEASVVLAGLERLGWWPFLAAVGTSNLLLAGFYGILGDWAAQREWLGVVLVAAAAVPLLVTVIVRGRRRR